MKRAAVVSGHLKEQLYVRSDMGVIRQLGYTINIEAAHLAVWKEAPMKFCAALPCLALNSLLPVMFKLN